MRSGGGVPMSVGEEGDMDGVCVVFPCVCGSLAEDAIYSGPAMVDGTGTGTGVVGDIECSEMSGKLDSVVERGNAGQGVMVRPTDCEIEAGLRFVPMPRIGFGNAGICDLLDCVASL
jgi:hypothetical protein